MSSKFISSAALVALLAALLCVSVSAQARPPPVRVSMAPPTSLKTFKDSASSFIADLISSANSPSTAYANYLKSVRKPVTAYNPTRWATVQANLKRISTLNQATKIKHVFGVTQFSDMSLAERQKFLGVNKVTRTKAAFRLNNVTALHTEATPQALDAAAEQAFVVASAQLAPIGRRLQQALEDIPDWTTVLPDIKNQGGCGSCWAFASTAAGEAASFINTGKIISLSEKQLVDCETTSFGCDGGWSDSAFQYMIRNGITSSANYPYVASKGTCPASLSPVSRLASYKTLASGNAGAMLEALKAGPFAAYVTVDNTFFEYTGGVFSSSDCSGPINHAVVVVGAGYDNELQAPYWLIRNSWGSSWGEGGYMRILRGADMCNIETYLYQPTSADKPDNEPNPSPNPGCTDTTVTVTSKTSLADLARQYKTTTAAIQIDNGLTGKQQLQDGQKLLIKCPIGTWSDSYGVWNGWNKYNAMVESPVVAQCPTGTFAVQFWVKPSQWYTANQWTGSTWVGTIKMTCSDGSELTIDAQPNFNPGWADGTATQCGGFTSIPLKAGWSVDSMFAVGAQSGSELVFQCPANTVVTGIAGGMSPDKDSKGWISNLQFQCRDPFATQGRLQRQLRSTFPRMTARLSCKVHVAAASDTWLTLVSRYGTSVNEIMRANPSVPAKFSAGTKIFIPPCTKGILQGTKVRSARAGIVVKGIKQNGPLVQAMAAAKEMRV